MSDPLHFHDYEFHFTSREVLNVTMLLGRDTLHESDLGEIVLKLYPAEDVEIEHIIHRDKLDATQITRRIEQPEPPEPSDA